VARQAAAKRSESLAWSWKRKFRVPVPVRGDYGEKPGDACNGTFRNDKSLQGTIAQW
jgi:hypothetical protein